MVFAQEKISIYIKKISWYIQKYCNIALIFLHIANIFGIEELGDMRDQISLFNLLQ
jgi:hypothetical protein